jgi:hypothetical protein
MRKAIAIIGEGITEKYYIESLKGLSPFTILPKELGRKASNLKSLEVHINTSINDGYDEVYCLIDMDGKSEGTAKTDYEKLKAKYHDKTHGNKKKGIQCQVKFIETERCVELWFLYHFTKSAITRNFASYEELEKELQKYRPNYQKTEKYFRSVGNLHLELTTKRIPNGSLKQAIQNSKNSIESKEQEVRKHTYSEMHVLIEALQIPL